MALLPCPECATQVSDRAGACPKCGHPLGTPAQPVRPPIAADGPVRDADGPAVSARKVGGMMAHGGNLRVRKGRLQLKGMLLEKDLGEVRNLQAVTVTKSLLSAKTEVVFGGADEGKWVIQAAPVPFFRGLEDQLGRKFVTAPEGGTNPQGLGRLSRNHHRCKRVRVALPLATADTDSQHAIRSAGRGGCPSSS